ncbi:MAG: bifunctional transaldolase/phosoglucose isomerase, partial [Deltaproteobacteria bacterium]|nr:bifunctional transaldolase/phosoglucose isomerase [Deltaproteobacteria bacterium]
QLISEGINVNVTLIFAREAYRDIAYAYLTGLERWAAKGGDASRVASVASFFVSRIDVEVDNRLQARHDATDDAGLRTRIDALRGTAAVANAKLAYRIYEEVVADPRWTALAAKGARPQRLLWASTGTKNPAYSDVKYVEELIGPSTVNTVPPKTFEAFADHGTATNALAQDVDGAARAIAELDAVGVDLDDVTTVLLDRGVVAFEKAIDTLFSSIAAMQRGKQGPRLDRTTSSLPAELADAVGQAARAWDADDGTTRLWAKDATLWTNQGEDRWLDWLDVVEAQRKSSAVEGLATLMKERGFTHALLLGMGGSSLGPDVLAQTFGPHVPKGSPTLAIVDSTDPGQVAAIEASVPLTTTVFIVSSKSGSTLEPKVLLQHFLHRMKATVGDAGSHFIAITDPGSKLEQIAKDEGFLRIFEGIPEIGGRFSAFSNFGIVPATIMGMNAADFLDETALMVDACRNGAATSNPGVELGLIIGAAAKAGRDKLTLVASPGIALFGAWLEQLVAESTGKQDKAVIPLEGEPLLPPNGYGTDRLFVHLRLRSTPDAAQDRAVAAIEAAGHPVVRIELDDVHALGQEMFRWEVATAVAGSVMGINPFDQPDVESAKIEARTMMEAYERDGSFPAQTPILADGTLTLFSDEANATALRDTAGEGADIVGLLRAHLERLSGGDYLALLAFIPMNDTHVAQLNRLRARVLRQAGVATCVGFGPRFLHSTGQAYKGGPNSGVFLQITCEDAQDLPVPEQRYTFGVVKAAQARGDFEVLVHRQRRALRVHLGADVTAGLAALDAAVEAAMQQENRP